VDKLVEAVFSAPTATLLVVAGLAFLAVAVVGNISGKISPGPQGRVAAGTIGALLLAGGIVMQQQTRPPQASPVREAQQAPLATPTQAQLGALATPLAVATLAAPPAGKVLVTDVEGRTTLLDLDSFDIGGDKEVRLQSGSAIRFERIRSIDIPQPDRNPLSLMITLTDGQVVNDALLSSLGPISSTFNGDSNLGKFEMSIHQVRRVQFPR